MQIGLEDGDQIDAFLMQVRVCHASWPVAQGVFILQTGWRRSESLSWTNKPPFHAQTAQIFTAPLRKIQYHRFDNAQLFFAPPGLYSSEL